MSAQIRIPKMSVDVRSCWVIVMWFFPPIPVRLFGCFGVCSARAHKRSENRTIRRRGYMCMYILYSIAYREAHNVKDRRLNRC